MKELNARCGSKKNGMEYSVEWVDQKGRKELEC